MTPDSDKPPVSAPPPADPLPTDPNAFANPPAPTAAPAGAPTAFDHIIPASNPDSLLSYYLGLFSIIPLAGLATGIIALVRGRAALRRVREDANLPGRTHAYVGIGCGAIGLLFNLLIVAFIIAIALNPRP